MLDQPFGFAPEEIRIDAPTRESRLKWVIVVSEALSGGRVVNAAACVAAATSASVTGLLGEPGADEDATQHAGLPWAGCSILVAEPDKLRRIRTKATGRDDVYVADMPLVAQETRVYREYLDRLADLSPDQIEYAAVSLCGPRKAVDRLVGGLRLLP